MFEKFYRARAATAVPGAGIGLAICKGLAEAARWAIWAEMTPGAERVSLHLAAATALARTPHAQPDRGGSSMEGAGGMRVSACWSSMMSRRSGVP